MFDLQYVYDPREVSGTYLPCRIPRALAVLLCRIRPHLDYAPNEDGTDEPYPVRTHVRGVICVVLLLLAVSGLACVQHTTGARTSSDVSLMPVCWEEVRDTEADYYCGTYAQSTERHVLRYVEVLPTQAVSVCLQMETAPNEADLRTRCVESFIDGLRDN